MSQVGSNLKWKPIISVLEVQPKLGVLVELEAEPKLQISVQSMRNLEFWL
jgi:hypothetical protein